jgi:hypothetical protein
VSGWVTPAVYIPGLPLLPVWPTSARKAAAKCQHVWSQELACAILSCAAVMSTIIKAYSGQHLYCSEKVSSVTSVTRGSLQPGVSSEACIYYCNDISMAAWFGFH